MLRRSLKMLALLMLLCGSISVGGCDLLKRGNPRTVLVPPGEVLKAGPDLRGHVYVRTDAGWELSDDTVSIPEGFYIVPPEVAQ